MARNLPDADEPHGYASNSPYEWNHSFLGWLSMLARLLTEEEVEKHVSGPIRATWPRAPILTADLLRGWIQYQIGYEIDLSVEAKAGWREICRWALEDPELVRAVKKRLARPQYGRRGCANGLRRPRGLVVNQSLAAYPCVHRRDRKVDRNGRHPRFCIQLLDYNA